MNTPKLFSFLTWSGPALLFLPSLALAQPNADNAPIAPNPPNQTPGGRGGNRGGRGGFGANLTDAQRQQLETQNRQWRQSQQRQRLVLAGVTDAPTQNAIVTYLEEGETARQKLREKWNTLSTAVRDGATTDTQLAALLNDFRGALDEERARRETARTALELKLGLSKNPRLDAQLTTAGLLGDEAAFVEGGNPRGGRGGRGGFGGGGFGFGGF